ncbi:MAG: hypothetical protein Q4A13_03375 [Fretibacterium sp.]|nr:hypothetical protein [Fretibacterium sp.]
MILHGRISFRGMAAFSVSEMAVKVSAVEKQAPAQGAAGAVLAA